MTARLLIERERDILTHLYYTRYATIEQVQRLCFTAGERKYAGKILARLRDEGYVRIRERAMMHEKMVYYLWTKGKKRIEDWGIASFEEVTRTAGVAGGMDDPIPHDLALTDIYVGLIQQVRELGFSFAWENTRMLKRRLSDFRLEPDAFVCLGDTVSTQDAFVEFTNDVPSPDYLKRRLNDYMTFYRRERPTPILWFTTSLAKRKQLSRVIDHFSYSDYVFLGLIEDVTKCLMRPVWYWQGREGQCFLNA